MSKAQLLDKRVRDNTKAGVKYFQNKAGAPWAVVRGPGCVDVCSMMSVFRCCFPRSSAGSLYE